jgi:hypothetical protein|tara:strand:- start:1141 stop:1299 length:159 start_codon:yes stop_codon:yes gene_type:complete
MKVGGRNRGSMDMTERLGQRHKMGQKIGGRYRAPANKGNSLMNRLKMSENSS